MRVTWGWLAVVLLATRALLGDDTRRVGDYGRPDRLVIHTQGTPPEAIRQALLRDGEVQVDSAPSGLLKDYLATIRRKVQLGFLASGFAHIDGNVTADDAGHILISVTEGQRLRYGRIHVHGATLIPTDRLIEMLTHTPPPETFRSSVENGQVHLGMDFQEEESDPIWDTGSFANLGSDYRDTVGHAVATALSRLGFFAATIRIQIAPEDGVATLNILIDTEGKRTTLQSIQVLGVKKNSPADVIRFLGLTEGQDCGMDQLQAAQRKLWESGRFKKHLIDVAFTDPNHSRMALRITLEELAGTPPLTQPLSIFEQTALKCGKWMLERCRGGDDLLLKLSVPEAKTPFTARLALGRDGLCARGQFPAPANSGPATAPTTGNDYAAVVTRQRVGLYSYPRRFVTDGKHPISGTIRFAYAPEVAPDGTAKWNFNLGAGFDLARTGIKLKLVAAPVGFVELAHRADLRSEIKDGVLTAQSPTDRIRIEVATGRLLECSILYEGMHIELSIGKGLVQTEADAIDKSASGRNECDPARPMESGMQFAADQLWAAVQQHPELKQKFPNADRMAAAIRLLGPPAAGVLERTFVNNDDPDPTFFIPMTRPAQPTGNYASLALSLLPSLDQAFSRESWPWTLSRQMLLVYGGLTQSFQPEMERVIGGKQMGPIGYLIAAEWLKQINPRAAVALAKIGLQHLSDHDFALDTQALTASDSASAATLRQWADHLRRLPPSEMKQLFKALPAGAGTPLEQLMELLQSRRSEPMETALPAALGDVWTVSLRETLKVELQSLAPVPSEVP